MSPLCCVCSANVIRYFPTQALNFMFKDFYKGVRAQRCNSEMTAQ